MLNKKPNMMTIHAIDQYGCLDIWTDYFDQRFQVLYINTSFYFKEKLSKRKIVDRMIFQWSGGTLTNVFFILAFGVSEFIFKNILPLSRC